MIQSRKLVAAAILFGLALIAAGLLVAPFNASARAAATAGDAAAADRIGQAFASLSDAEPHPALKAAALHFAKGDLEVPAHCIGAAWPNIDPSCLTTSDGAPAPHVRTITIGYEAGGNTTVLMRVPAAELAAR